MTNATPFNAPAGQGLFVTGTDTAVGKTTVTAALGLALKQSGFTIGVMKPVETGIATQTAGALSDGTLLHRLLTPEEDKDLISPYQFEKAVAPLNAAGQAKSSIQFETIVDCYRTLSNRHEYVLVEGIGGILVPLTEGRDVRDLVRLLRLPCLLVSRTELGAVNHSRLTLAALQDHGIPVLAIILNEARPPTESADRLVQQESTVHLIQHLCPLPVLGPLPYVNDTGQDWKAKVEILSRTRAIQDLARLVSQGG